MEVHTGNRLTGSEMRKFAKCDKAASIALRVGCYGCDIDTYDGTSGSELTLTAVEMRKFAEELLFLSGIQSSLEEAKNDG